MRVFGLSILLAKNLDRVHALSRSRMVQIENLTHDLRSAQNTVIQHREEINALRVRSSLFNVSKITNALRNIAEIDGADVEAQGAKSLLEEVVAGAEAILKGIKDEQDQENKSQSKTLSGAELPDTDRAQSGVLQEPLVSSAATLTDGNKE